MEPSKNADYMLLQDTDSSAETGVKIDSPVMHQRKKFVRWLACTAILCLLILASASGAAYAIFRAEFFTLNPDQFAQNRLTGGSPSSCGGSREEALAAGCKFDVMSFSWLPPRCYDGELVAEFEALGPWEWFIGQDGRVAADEEAVREGRLDRLYVTWEFHLLHCTFQWKKMHRALLAGWPIDSYIGNFSHTQHCEHMIMNRRTPLNSTGTDIFIKYPSCGLA